jgi:catalase
MTMRKVEIARKPDIVAHSTNGFPVRTGEEFLEFLRAAAAFGAG